jgi:hypothetical protein
MDIFFDHICGDFCDIGAVQAFHNMSQIMKYFSVERGSTAV